MSEAGQKEAAPGSGVGPSTAAESLLGGWQLLALVLAACAKPGTPIDTLSAGTFVIPDDVGAPLPVDPRFVAAYQPALLRVGPQPPATVYVRRTFVAALGLTVALFVAGEPLFCHEASLACAEAGWFLQSNAELRPVPRAHVCRGSHSATVPKAV